MNLSFDVNIKTDFLTNMFLYNFQKLVLPFLPSILTKIYSKYLFSI